MTKTHKPLAHRTGTDEDGHAVVFVLVPNAGKECRLFLEDWERLKDGGHAHGWVFTASKADTGYVRTKATVSGRIRNEPIARLILGAVPREIVKLITKDPFNLRRDNLFFKRQVPAGLIFRTEQAAKRQAQKPISSAPPGPELTLNFDGGSRGNPGPSGIGIVITDASGEPVYELGDCLQGEPRTCSEAEYSAVIRGLEAAKYFSPSRLTIIGDSQLIICQLRGTYKVKAENLRPLHAEAIQLLLKFPGHELKYQPRAHNDRADSLYNRAMKEGQPVEPLGCLARCVDSFIRRQGGELG